MKDRTKEQQPSAVPETAQQGGDIRVRWAWVEPAVWTERMLATLETGIEGGKWFRLTAQCLLHHGWPVLLKTGACCGLPIFFEVTTNWRAGCQKLACPVRREGRPESSSLPLSRHTRATPNAELRTLNAYCPPFGLLMMLRKSTGGEYTITGPCSIVPSKKRLSPGLR